MASEKAMPGIDFEFSDILRHLSASPHLGDIDSSATQIASVSPDDPPDLAEIQRMRDKLFGMGIVESQPGHESITTSIDIGQRERELAEMVLRLTHPALYPIPSQLIDQANTISQLTKQRDFLLKQHQEERDMWDAERDNWVRIAGALTARRIDDGVVRQDALERENLNLVSDNVQLKRKLQDQQTRLEALEAELKLLRPILLLRPPSPPPAKYHPVPSLASTPAFVAAQSKTPAPATPHRPTSPTHNPLGPSAPNTTTKPRKASNAKDAKPIAVAPLFSSYLLERFSDDDLDLHHSKRSHNPMKYSTTSDARSEHLLLASRKLGKQKIASLLPHSGFPAAIPGSAAVSFASLGLAPNFIGATPATQRVLAQPPKNPQVQQRTPLGPNASTPFRPHPSSPSKSVAPSPASPTRRPQNQLAPRTPKQHPTNSSPVRSQQQPQRSQPCTPSGSNTNAFDQLLTASRILDSTGGPVKRRRIDSQDATATSTEGAGSSGLGRMMSGLDVLAEQAAVAISQSPRKPGTDPAGPSSGGDIPTTPTAPNQLLEDHEGEVEEVTPRQHRRRASKRIASKGKEKEKEKVREMSVATSASGLRSPIAIRPSPTQAGSRRRKSRSEAAEGEEVANGEARSPSPINLEPEPEDGNLHTGVASGDGEPDELEDDSPSTPTKRRAKR
ncbi:hypothetical protein FRC03_007789 [Tulasnella sp. 419]|nr:hypothetical protein FRC03_007789 [Tulasnella sp. 419]